MNTSSSILLASRLLFPKTGKKSNARRSLIGAMFCIGISLIPLVMILTVANGMIQGITDRMIGLASSHISCVFQNSKEMTSSVSEIQKIAKELSNVAGVQNSFAEIQGTGLASSNIGRSGSTIRSVERDVFERNKSFSSLFKVIEGKTSFDSDNSAIIGTKLAETLKLKVGDTLRLITIRHNEDGKFRPRITPFKVSGIISSGYQELDALWVFIPIETGFKVLSTKSAVFTVGIETADAYSVELEKVFRSVQKAVPEYTKVNKWNELHAAEYENLSSTRIMLLFIMLLIVLVASVNISSALVMLVMERRKEIAIIKSLGGSSIGIAFAFLLTGIVTGGFGVLFGIPLGIFCAVNFNTIMSLIEKLVNVVVEFSYMLTHDSVIGFSEIKLLDPAYYLQDIPLSIPLLQLVIIASGTLVLSLLVSVLPAMKAGSEKPIETLRKI